MDGSIANDLFTEVSIVGKSLTDVEVPGFT
jgi:hypothetical protein